jgi:uncharacterized membrane protein
MLAVMAVLAVVMRGFRAPRRGIPLCGTGHSDGASGRLGGGGDATDRDPLVTLRERYASGEIDHPEFGSTPDAGCCAPNAP